MDHKRADNDDQPMHDPKEIEQEAQKSRRHLEEVPEPGTDPLHDGP